MHVVVQSCKMNTELLARLLELLPLHAEEDGVREEITTAELLAHMAPEGRGCPEAEAVLATVQRLFDALCLLDRRPTLRDRWAFVSFPASLVGHSLLRTLASPDQTLYPADFWREGDMSSERIEEQRRLLHALEDGRVRFGPEGTVQPIRFVHVAWGIIRLGRHFLLRHREDKSRPDAAGYVIPGGRFRLSDLPTAQQTAVSLRQLHNGHSDLALAALPVTLKRELEEELRILPGEHYTARQRCIVGPYRKVEGAKNRHAYTEYQFVLYEIKLTPLGEAIVLEGAHMEPNLLAWFTLEDILSPVGRADGRRAFVDALREQMGEGFEAFLQATPDSGGTPYRLTDEAQAVDLPAAPGQAFRIGRTGDEKEQMIPLTTESWALLWTIMTHDRGLRLTAEKHLALLGGGWIKPLSAEAEHAAQVLMEALTHAGLPLIQRIAGGFLRAAIAPDCVYFAPDAFHYHLTESGQKGELELALAADLAPWATLALAVLRIDLNRNMTRALLAIGMGEDPVSYSEEAMKKGIKEMLDNRTRPFGLRKFVRTVASRYRIVVPQAI